MTNLNDCNRFEQMAIALEKMKASWDAGTTVFYQPLDNAVFVWFLFYRLGHY